MLVDIQEDIAAAAGTTFSFPFRHARYYSVHNKDCILGLIEPPIVTLYSGQYVRKQRRNLYNALGNKSSIFARIGYELFSGNNNLAFSHCQ